MIILHMVVLGVVSAVGALATGTVNQPEQAVWALCFLLTALFAWCFGSWLAATGSLFDPYTLLLLAVYLFHGAQPSLELFHLNPDGLLHGRLEVPVLLQMIYFTALCVAFLHLGALLAFCRMNSWKASPGPKGSGVHPDEIRFVGWALLLISIVPAGIVMREQWQLWHSSGYIALFQQSSSRGLGYLPQVVGTLLIPGLMFLLASGRDAVLARTVAFATLAVTATASMLIGDRSSAIMPVIAFGWLWHRSIRPLPAIFLMCAGVFFLVVVFPLVALVRSDADAKDWSTASVTRMYTSIDNPAIQILDEMGGSLATVGYTMDLVPSQFPHGLGQGYIAAALDVVPNFVPFFHMDTDYGDPDTWLTHQIAPEVGAQGMSYGYSFIAQAYLEFGWLGAPVVMLLIGVVFGLFGAWSRTGDLLLLAFVATFCSFAFHAVRGTALELARPLVWYSLAPYAGVLVTASVCRHRVTGHSIWVAGSAWTGSADRREGEHP